MRGGAHRRLSLAALRQLPPRADHLLRGDARHLPPDRRRAGRSRRSHALRDDGLGRGGARRRDRGVRERQARVGLVDAGRRRPAPAAQRRDAGDGRAGARGHPAGRAARQLQPARGRRRGAARPARARRAGRRLRQRVSPRWTRSSTAAPSTCSAHREDLGPSATPTSRCAGSRPARRSSAAAARPARSTSPRCATGCTRRASRRPRPDQPLPSRHARRAADRPPAGRRARR